MSVSKMLAGIGISTPKPDQLVLGFCREDRPLSTQGRPFEWDRPGTGLYDNGQIRILWRDKKGNFEFCRMATDQEVKFIMIYERVEELITAENARLQK